MHAFSKGLSRLGLAKRWPWGLLFLLCSLAGMAQSVDIGNDKGSGEGGHSGYDCDSTPVKLKVHDTVLWNKEDTTRIDGLITLSCGTVRIDPANGNSIANYYIVEWKALFPLETENGLTVKGSVATIEEPGMYAYRVRGMAYSRCPDREGDTIRVRCDTSQVKFNIRDTIIAENDTITFGHNRSCILFHEICYGDLIGEGFWKDSIYCYLNDDYGISVSGTKPGAIVFSKFKSKHPNCPDRPGDTVYINAKRGCDSTAVKSPVHDTALCAGDTLWLHIPDSSLWGYDLVWQNTSSMADVIYHQGNPVPIRDTGVYIYNVYNLLNNDCPDREGDTIRVSYWPKPETFLPRDTVQACGGSNSAPVFTLNQSGINVFWSDSSTKPIYRFAYQGDTIDKRYCTLKNVCGDSLRDSVVVHFLPPYAYLGGDSIIGCKGDTLLFDAGQWNRHLPNYQKLRYVWTLRDDTVLTGSIAETDSLALLNPDSAYLDPTQLQLVLPQDTGLLIVRVQAAMSDESDTGCPVATDTIDLQLYPWPDIDFFVRAGDTTICYYDSIELFLDRDSLVFSPDAYYIWLFDSVPYDTTADEIFYAADSGLYTVTGVNYCSRHSESFFLRHHPVERITVTLTDTTVCPDIPVSIDPTLKNYTGNRYVWFKSGGEGGDEGGGTYVTPRPNARFSQFKNPGEEPDNDNYNEWPWDFSAALWVDTAGSYVLYVMDTAGCMANYKYSVNTEDCTPQIEAPNVFTPNGDGVNDEFTLKTMEKLFNFEISIFNRWGQQVKSYKGKPEDFSWDGRFNSSLEAPDGVYFYFITYENYKGKKKKLSGAVTILR